VTEKSASPSPEGTHKGWLQSSTCRDVEEAGKAAGCEYGLTEATAETYARLLNRQARQKFGCADADGRRMLDGLAEGFACARLEELADRLLTGSSWASWLDGVVVPPRAPGLPEYSKNLEMDFERSGPSIDTHMKVGLKSGGDSIVHLRFQKWYQPDLDRHLFEESCKIERKFGKMPMVVVFLMWPPAEGPGTTGRFEERDANNKVKRIFTYNIRKAWEIEPEEATTTIGTMLLAPLTRDSRRRMPEVVQMVKKGLDQCRADAETRSAVWDAVYWSMGLICSLDEAHRALGDMLRIIQSSTHYLAAKGHAFVDAYTVAQRVDGPLAAARGLVLRQAIGRFGPSPDAEAALAAVTDMSELEKHALRVLIAPDWASLLAKA
jgi:hypothetical protein